MVSSLHISNSSLDIIRSDYDLSLLSIYLLVFNPILLKMASKRKVFKPHSTPSHSERRPVRSSGMYKADPSFMLGQLVLIVPLFIYIYLYMNVNTGNRNPLRMRVRAAVPSLAQCRLTTSHTLLNG